MHQWKNPFQKMVFFLNTVNFLVAILLFAHFGHTEELAEADKTTQTQEFSSEETPKETASQETPEQKPATTVNLETNPSLKLAPYGFVKANYLGSNHSLDSFGNTNLSAPTTVHPNTDFEPNHYQSSMQVQQSRLGLWLETNSKIKAQTEIDFFNAQLASGTTGAHPRLRIAKIVYKPTETYELIVGQDWDIINQLNPFTYNIIGQNFNSGDAGFMRQQVKLKTYLNEKVTLTFSVGMAMKNETIINSSAELNNIPTFAFALRYTQDNQSYAGLAAIGTKIRIASPSAYHHQPAYGFFLYEDLKLDAFTEILSQIFYGKNLSNIGTLSLGQGTYRSDVEEWGGFISANFALKKCISLFGGFGLDQIANAQGSTIYTYSTPLNITGNKKATLGIKDQVSQALTFYLEANQFWTSFVSTANANYGQKSRAQAMLLELGAIINF